MEPDVGRMTIDSDDVPDLPPEIPGTIVEEVKHDSEEYKPWIYELEFKPFTLSQIGGFPQDIVNKGDISWNKFNAHTIDTITQTKKSCDVLHHWLHYDFVGSKWNKLAVSRPQQQMITSLEYTLQNDMEI